MAEIVFRVLAFVLDKTSRGFKCEVESGTHFRQDPGMVCVEYRAHVLRNIADQDQRFDTSCLDLIPDSHRHIYTHVDIRFRSGLLANIRVLTFVIRDDFTKHRDVRGFPAHGSLRERFGNACKSH